jgi:hypothetical protein
MTEVWRYKATCAILKMLCSTKSAAGKTEFEDDHSQSILLHPNKLPLCLFLSEPLAKLLVLRGGSLDGGSELACAGETEEELVSKGDEVVSAKLDRRDEERVGRSEEGERECQLND